MSTSRDEVSNEYFAERRSIGSFAQPHTKPCKPTGRQPEWV
jgi:hypothetical protein